MTMTDIQFGGGTNAKFLFGFGGALGSLHLPEAQPDIKRSLWHYSDGGVEIWFPSVSWLVVPFTTNPPQKPIKQSGFLQGEELFNVQQPQSKVLCPLYFKKDHLVIRLLSIGKLLRLYQLPLAMNTTLSPILKLSVGVSFACAASCVMFTSVLCQLWGVGGGREKRKIMEMKLVKGMKM